MSPPSTRAPDDDLNSQALHKIATLLLSLAMTALAACVFLGLGWYRSVSQPSPVEAMSSEGRQRLVADLIDLSPGVHRWAYFEPSLGYTLRPQAELEIWNSRFTTNGLGFRTGPAAKVPGTFRIVFVGDSWTFGMGVHHGASFPEVVAGLANRHAGISQTVEAWTLALPGYNLHNSLSGLDFFFERLQPDAVVIVPSGNDNHSSNTVLPNGSLWGDGLAADVFGEPHQLTYRARRLDSYRFQERWRMTFQRVRQSERQLQRAGVPLFLFFLARWEPIDAHLRVAEAGLEAPYTVVPTDWTRSPWVNPPPIGHGTVDAQQLYARLLYRGLAQQLAWDALPLEPSETLSDGKRLRPADIDEVDTIPIFQKPPLDDARNDRYRDILRRNSQDLIGHRFAPPHLQPAQVAGPVDPETGWLRRAATILIRPKSGHQWVEVTVRPLADTTFIYPMTLNVRIPSPGGGTEGSLLVEAENEPQHVVLPIPDDLEPGQTLDVVLSAQRSTSAPQLLANRSLVIEAIQTLP